MRSKPDASLEELEKAVRAARAIALAANTLSKRRIPAGEWSWEDAVNLLLKLAREGGAATISRLGERGRVLAAAEALKELITIHETPMRTILQLTPKGRKVAEEFLALATRW